ncbi:MAG: hypothetical protein R6T98_08835 [Desulfatiglandales bacterium]
MAWWLILCGGRVIGEKGKTTKGKAQRAFEGKYTAERNYEMLMAIYEKAIDVSKKQRADG